MHFHPDRRGKVYIGPLQEDMIRYPSTKPKVEVRKAMFLGVYVCRYLIPGVIPWLMIVDDFGSLVHFDKEQMRTSSND